MNKTFIIVWPLRALKDVIKLLLTPPQKESIKLFTIYCGDIELLGSRLVIRDGNVIN